MLQCFQLSTSRPRPRPCFHHPRLKPGLIHARILTVTARSQLRPRPPPPADLCSHGARASTRVICARILLVQSRDRAQASRRKLLPCANRKRLALDLTVTAAGRAQRHWRVNSDTRDRTNRLPEHCRATRKTPAKSRRDGMLVVLPATIYTCNGVWYNQPSSTERFRYVLLLARIMRRCRSLRLFHRVSSRCDLC